MSYYILDTDDLVLSVKDADGNALEFRGYVVGINEGEMLEIECSDISSRFGKMRCLLQLENQTLGQIIEAMVENPTGEATTGITANCMEVDDPYSAGVPLVFKNFYGLGDTVASWLDQFLTATGYRWYIDYTSASGWRFHWYNPTVSPEWTVTLKDSIDRADNSATQLRVKDGVIVSRDRRNYANRIWFTAREAPPPAPPGYTTADGYTCEATTPWTAYTNTTIATDDTDYRVGSYAITFTWDYTPGSSVASTYYPMGYIRMPACWQNQLDTGYGGWAYTCKATMTIDGDSKTVDDFWVGSYIWYLTCESDITSPPTTRRATSNHSFRVSGGTAERWTTWKTGAVHGLDNFHIGWSDTDQEHFDHIPALGFGFGLWVPSTTSRAYLTGGKNYVVKFWLDNLRPIERSSPLVPLGDQDPALTEYTGTYCVESAAVTAGTEAPLDDYINAQGMTVYESYPLAYKKLAVLNKTQVTLSNMTLDGIRNIPMQTRVPVELNNSGVSGSYSPVQIDWKPLDSGDETVLIIGDVPFDESRNLEALKKRLSSLKAGSRR